MYVLEILCRTVAVGLDLLSFFLLLRVLFSFFFFEEESRPMMFLVAATEPFIIPFRILFDRCGWFQNLPIDVPFLAASIVICIVSSIL